MSLKSVLNGVFFSVGCSIVIAELILEKNETYPPFGCANFGGCSDLVVDSPMECAPGACLCQEGYTGTYCEEDLGFDYCASDPCNNDGSQDCTSIPSGSYTCTCAAGYNGPNCTSAALSPDPCAMHFDYCGVYDCITNASANSWGMQCDCPAGKTGNNCSDSIRCTSDADCFFGGTCTDQGGCSCLDHFSGGQCSSYDQCTFAQRNDSLKCIHGWCEPFFYVASPTSFYKCVCDAGWTGERCDILIDNCESTPCLNGGSCKNAVADFSCVCVPGYTEKDCGTIIDNCESSPCMNGATCVNDVNSFSCDCALGYTDSLCTTVINYCESSPCVNQGTCTTFIGYFECDCPPGYNDTTCSTHCGACNSSPCMYGGTCVDMADGGYNCTCVPGVTGTNCEITACSPVQTANGVMHPSPCQIFDINATCIDDLASYTCQCSPAYTDVRCNISIATLGILEQMFSPLPYLDGFRDVSACSDNIFILADINSDPTRFTTAFLYELTRLDPAQRAALSWNVNELFEWIVFERRELDKFNDLFMFNDQTLGNCFTFNHRNSSRELYSARRTGDSGGLLARLNSHQEENLPYVMVSSFNVFVHAIDEDVYYDSCSYQPKLATQTRLAFYETQYNCIAGHGRCASNSAAVPIYYGNPDVYSQQACFRSCYQRDVITSCGCGDPSYALPNGIPACNISRRACVEDFKAVADSPRSWRDCVCPMACTFSTYDVTSSTASHANICRGASNVTECFERAANIVDVSVSYSSTELQVYKEYYAIQTSSFLSYVGGLGGVFLGMSLIIIPELIVLVIKLAKAMS